MKRAYTRRKQRGNMLVLSCVCMAVLALAIIIGCSFANLFFVYNRLQTSADEIALAGARALNQHDQIGQMNNMIGRCRQLVYSSEQNLQNVVANYPHLDTLAREIRDEDRSSAATLESQRNVLRSVATSRAQIAMVNKFNQVKGSYNMVLPWLRTNMARLLAFRLGRIESIQSNVGELTGIEALSSSDRTRGYVQASLGGSGMSLYKEGIDARLPDSNTDLVFKLSSLAAPVVGTVSPTRIAQARVFRVLVSDQIPSATQVKLSLAVATSLGVAATAQLSATGTAATTGGSLQQ